MNEMIYGNSGKRDEGINIDMEQDLFQRVQNRNFVPKLKSMLNGRLQGGDKSFVFVGEVADRAGSFSLYGYNAKLENDERGGDYGHYIAVPVVGKTVKADMENVGFLTEDGFIEYVNLKTLNDEKRFKINPRNVEVDINAKKKIVNNLMETFMKVRKRKNVTFSFSDCPIEEFNEKSLFVLIELMKYLPYCIRKNISFISHVDSNQKLPDLINLAVYPENSEYKPRDCIALSGAVFEDDGVFSEYVEKVFAMNDSEREAYFEEIYEKLEKVSIEKGIDVKSDLYLLDVLTEKLWANGDINEALDSIFNSVSDVLAVYPHYKELACGRMSNNFDKVVEYIKGRIGETKAPVELKAVFDNVKAVFDICDFQIKDEIKREFMIQANKFLENAGNDERLINVSDEIIAITHDIFDREAAEKFYKANMCEKTDINGMYSFYLKLKEKNYIDVYDLNICLTESVEGFIEKVTGRYGEAKDKLSALERMYSEFCTACIQTDYALVSEVYNRYKMKFEKAANAASASKGNEIIYEIDRKIREHCPYFDIKNHIKELATIDVGADNALKKKASDIYRKLSAKMFGEIRDEELTYEDLKRLIFELEPAVKNLNGNGVYDEHPMSGVGQDNYVPDGMYRFVTIFGTMINTLGNADNLTEALIGLQETKNKIRDEEKLQRCFQKFAPLVLSHWLDKNPKFRNQNALKKAEKKCDEHISSSVEDMFIDCIEKKSNHRKKKKIPIVNWIVIGAIVIVSVGLIGAAICVGRHFIGGKKTGTNPVNTNTQLPNNAEAERAGEGVFNGQKEKEDESKTKEKPAKASTAPSQTPGTSTSQSKKTGASASPTTDANSDKQ